jgi:hypothetical protein
MQGPLLARSYDSTMFSISQDMEIERCAEIVWPCLASLEQVPFWAIESLLDDIFPLTKDT